MSDLAILTSLKTGVRAFRQHWLFFIGLLVILFVINIAPGLLELTTQNLPGSELLTFIVYLSTIVIQIIVGMGTIRVALTIVDGDQPTYRQLFSEYRKFWRFLAATVLLGVITFLGLFLLVIPGIIWGIKYRFVTYLIIDRNQSVFEAFHTSGTITRGHKWKLFLLFILYFLLNLIGVFTFGVGFLITIPIVIVSFAHIYRQLLAASVPSALPGPLSGPSAPQTSTPPPSQPTDHPLPPNVSPGLKKRPTRRVV